MHNKPNTGKADRAPKNTRQNRRERAVLAILENPSIDKAAETVGVHPSTLWRWLKEPEFQQELRQARQQCFWQATNGLQRVAPAAVTVLYRVMADTDAPPSSRVQAAKGVLDQCRKSIEADDLVQRVEALERIASTETK
jgi:hypothetical protein